MNNDIAHLSPERHYTAGSASAGRYATDPRRRPDMTRLPTQEDLARRKAARPAWQTRFLREQNVLGWVTQFDQARTLIEALRQEILQLEAIADTPVADVDEKPADDEPTVDVLTTGDVQATDEKPADSEKASATKPTDSKQTTGGERVAVLRARLVRAEDRKREASRQLRLLGISPRAQAILSQEIQERIQDTPVA